MRGIVAITGKDYIYGRVSASACPYRLQYGTVRLRYFPSTNRFVRIARLVYYVYARVLYAYLYSVRVQCYEYGTVLLRVVVRYEYKV